MPLELRHFGSYEILGPIGAGGMGEVYKARDTRLDRIVALKILPSDFAQDKDRVRRFITEAKAAAAISHPNIAQIFEIGETNNIRFIAMEYIEGSTLDALIQVNPLETSKVVQIGIQVANALQEAHQKGITHRDIKPSNIMLNTADRVKVLDFGLAKVIKDLRSTPGTEISTITRTRPGTVFGTIQYLSPEQALGHEADRRSDIFSLGIVIYELSTRQLPFHGATAGETLDQIIHAQPKLPSQVDPRFPANLERIILKCLEKNAERRYQSASALSEDLTNLKTKRLHLPFFARRAFLHRLISIPLVAVLAISVALFTVILWPKPQRTASKQIDSIAVLPLADLSGDPEQEYFSDGMTDALISNLAKIQALRVISRTSVMRYKGTKKPLRDIARDLNIDALVEGSVFRSGPRVRIVAKLIDATSETLIWSETYERDLLDIMTLQREVATSIAKEIRVKVMPEEQRRLDRAPPVNPEALEAYLKGLYYCNRFKYDKGTAFLEQAVAIDSNYAQAYASIASCHVYRALNGFDPTFLPRAKSAAEKALALDDDLAEAHTALAHVKLGIDWDWFGSQEEHRRAIELNPNSAVAHALYSFYLRLIGHFDEAIQEARQALHVDPVSASTAHSVAVSYFDASHHDEAIVDYNKVFELDPNYVGSHAHLGWTYARKGMIKEALLQAEKVKELSPSGEAIGLDAWVYGIYVRTGKATEAQQLLQTWVETSRKRYVSTYNIARMYACSGQNDQAFQWLKKGYEEHSPSMVYLKVDDYFDNLHQDPRYIELVRNMRFPGL